MQRYGLYDATRGLTTVAAAGGAGVLLWAATLVGQQTDKRFWAEMGDRRRRRARPGASRS